MQAHANPDYPIVIFFDGHGSHVTVRMIELARKCGVHLFCLPPHTTHKLQPLDVGVFGPLQHAWRKNCEEFSATNGRGMGKPEFIKEYMKVREETFTPELIAAAWWVSGLYPLNLNTFKDLDYSPSQVTSTNTCYPSSFPVSLVVDPSPPGTPPPSTIMSRLNTPPPSPSSPSALTDIENIPTYHPITPCPSQPEPVVNTAAPLIEQLVSTTEQVRYWREWAYDLHKQLGMNTVHLTFSARENDQLRKKLHAKSKPKEPRGQGLKGQARLLTTDEVREIEIEKAAEKAEKERKRLEKQEQRLHEEAKRARMRDVLGHNIRFTKPLRKMLRSELNDVIAVMSLSREQKNIQDCVRTIEAHVETFPDLKVDPRFGRIFDNRYTTPPPEQENIPCPAPLPNVLYRFDTPKPDIKEDIPSASGSFHSATPVPSSSAQYYNPYATPFVFPPSIYGYPPSPYNYSPSRNHPSSFHTPSANCAPEPVYHSFQ